LPSACGRLRVAVASEEDRPMTLLLEVCEVFNVNETIADWFEVTRDPDGPTFDSQAYKRILMTSD
jgi:hypothetical protein